MINDRFRFRAWSKSDKRYYDVVALGQDRSALEEIGWVKNTDDFVFEQCTGLKDKNGKLIYEGDILKYSYHAHPDSSVCTNTCSVFWFGDGWGINPITGNRLIDFPETAIFHSQLYEVIGNIHERDKK